MSILLNIALIVLLAIAFYQDWKTRSIHVVVLISLAVTTSVLFYQMNIDWKMVGLNLAFITVVMGGLFLYISFKEGRFLNIFKAHFGIGDVVFFIAVSPLFSNENFILFFISGMILSGCTHLIISKTKEESTIPLAGYLSIYLIGLIGMNQLIEADIFYQTLI
jgi:hypothetical protein